MTSRVRFERGMHFMAWLVCAGCADEVVVATEQCTDPQAQCSTPPMDAVEHVAEIRVESLPEISSYRIEPLPIAELPEANLLLTGVLRLTGDSEGNPWLFAADLEAEGVRVSRLDEDGQTIDSTVLAPPKGAWLPSQTPVLPNVGAALLPSMPQSRTSSRWPAARVVWQRACKPSTVECALVEKVIFENNELEDPLRRVMVQDGDDLFENDHGERFTTTHGGDDGPIVSKFGLDGTSIWNPSIPWANPYSLVKAVPLADGRVAVELDDSATSSPWRSWYYIVEQDGKLTRSWDSAWFDPGSKERTYLASASGVPVRIVSDAQGDLEIRWVQESPARADGVKFLRTDYASLVARAFSVTASGVVYVVTPTGGRDAPRSALCRAARDSTGSCALLPKFTDARTGEERLLTDIVARDSGVVFGRAGTNFVRLQFGE